MFREGAFAAKLGDKCLPAALFGILNVTANTAAVAHRRDKNGERENGKKKQGERQARGESARGV